MNTKRKGFLLTDLVFKLKRVFHEVWKDIERSSERNLTPLDRVNGKIVRRSFNKVTVFRSCL